MCDTCQVDDNGDCPLDVAWDDYTEARKKYEELKRKYKDKYE